MTYGEMAYEAFAKALDLRSTWESLPIEQRLAWEEAANAVAEKALADEGSGW